MISFSTANTKQMSENDPNMDTADKWDTLRFVPFAGDKSEKTEEPPVIPIRTDLRERIQGYQRHITEHNPSAQSFIYNLLDELQPLLSSSATLDLYDDYTFWWDALQALIPYISKIWPECDPFIVRCLYSFYVVEIMLLLRLWHMTGYDGFKIKDCAILGESYIGIGIIQKSILSSLADRWQITEYSKNELIED